MKKKVITTIILLVTVLMVGCGEQETNSNDTDVQLNQNDEQQETDVSDIEGIHITDGPKYQYQVISPEDIVVEYTGLKPDKPLSEYEGNYVTDTSVYLSDSVGVYLGEEHFEARVSEYVQYVDISFKWNVSNWDLYALMRRQLEVSTDLFEGTISYADGYTDSISAERVDLQRDGNILKVLIYYRGDESVGYEFEVPESWEDANYTEQSQEEIEEWYESLGGDPNVSSTSDKISYTPEGWSVKVMDYSNMSFEDQVVKMYNINRLWYEGVEFTNDGVSTIEGEDVVREYEFIEDSEWVQVYGHSDIDYVFKMFGLPDYGGDSVKCGHGEGSYIGGITDRLRVHYGKEFVDSFRDGYKFNGPAGTRIINMPFSWHKINTMPFEEFEKYLLEVYKIENGRDSLYKDEYLLKYLGMSSESILTKFNPYLYGLYVNNQTLDIVNQMHRYACEYMGYDKDIFSWYNEDDSVLKGYIVGYYTKMASLTNWQCLSRSQVEMMSSLGINIPSYVTYEEDCEGTVSDYYTEEGLAWLKDFNNTMGDKIEENF